MSASIWIPLGKLTFAAYLIYPIVVGSHYYNSQTTTFASYPSLIYAMISNIILVYLFALPLYLFIQAPIAGVIKVSSSRIFSNRNREGIKGKYFYSQII